MRIRCWSLALALLMFAPWTATVSGVQQKMPQLKPSSTFRFDRYALDYPTSYTPQPLSSTDPGGFFTSTSPFGFLFAVMSRPGEDTVIPQGRFLANAMLDRLARANQIVTQTVTDIPADQLPPKVTLGKSLDAVTAQGLTLHAGFYLTEVGGRKVLVGYATLSCENIRPELRHLITPYPDDVVQDFRQMVETLRIW